MQIDHAFICTLPDAPAARRLSAAGLLEGSAGSHPGQGTANRRFFFRNFMLELLWITNKDEALSERGRRLGLYERCLGGPDICPFGIAFRPDQQAVNLNAGFAWWDYHPVYLPEQMSVQVACNVPLHEPLLFHLPFLTKAAERNQDEPTGHPLGCRNLTGLTVEIPGRRPLSHAAGIINHLSTVHIVHSHRYAMRLEFDHGKQNTTREFIPELPLIYEV
jgi:hypothetical protein